MYAIPWPPAFQSLLSALRVFLVDVVSITRTNCAQPMNYYASMVVVLVGVKLVRSSDVSRADAPPAPSFFLRLPCAELVVLCACCMRLANMRL